MTLYKPGHGKGRAMHIQRVRALQRLEEAGLIKIYRHYTPEDGYALTTMAGEHREVASTEMAAYLAGALDMYQGVRQHVEAEAGERAMEKLDDLFLDALADAAAPFLSTDDAGEST